MDIIWIIVRYWKLFVGALAGMVAVFFAWNYRSRGEQIQADERAIKGLKAKEKVAQKNEIIKTERDKKIREVKDAQKDSLRDRLNNLPE